MSTNILDEYVDYFDRLCGLVVTVAGYKRSGLDSRKYHIFWEILCLEWGALSLERTIEKLLGRNNSCFGLKTREYDGSLRWPRDTLYPRNLLLTSPTSGGRSVGRVRSRTKATEFFFFFFLELEIASSPTYFEKNETDCRIWRVLTIMYNAQNKWTHGLCP
jgi:hypothetical protein